MPARAGTSYGWFFLVARGRRTGYRALLVPDFLVGSNEAGALSEAANGDPPVAGTFRVSSVTGLAAGDITVAYRTERFTSAPAGELVIDQHGRPLDLLYGFVCRGPGLAEVDAADFPPAREAALGVYHRFLADESGFTPQSSPPQPLRSTVSDLREPAAEPVPTTTPPVPPPVPARAGRPGRWRVALAVAGLLAVSAVAWSVILGGGDDGVVTDVSVGRPPADPVDCGSPIPFTATIRTKGPATVVYHWESDAGTTDSSRQQIVFDQAAEQSVATTVTLTGTAGEQLDGAQTLVVDGPNTRQDKQSYRLTCK